MSLGNLIVFEGPDGVGKTALSHALLRKLTDQAVNVQWFGFPGRDKGTLGELVYRLHHEKEAFGLHALSQIGLQALHLAAHLDAIERTILPALRSGVTVILDRYWWSTWVYGHYNHVDESVLSSMIDTEQIAWSGVTPQVVFTLQRRCEQDSSDEAGRRRLNALYESLQGQEQSKYPVCFVNNDSSAEATLEFLHSYLSKVV